EGGGWGGGGALGAGAGGARERPPAAFRGLLPVPPRQAPRAVGRRQRAEGDEIGGRGVFIGLAQGRDQTPIDQVLRTRVREHVRHRGPDRLPVHLRRVELRAIGP